MILTKDEQSASEAAHLLSCGKVGILPTDTVYGFSGIVDVEEKKFLCDEKIRLIKGRSETKPFIQLISKPEDIYKYSEVELPEQIVTLWPGPLTVIVPVKKDLYMAQKTPTVAFRCPGDEWLRKVIGLCNKPIYSTSANRSGQKIIEEIDGIKSEFEAEVDFIVADGDRKNGVPSTLITIENGAIKVLRQGAIHLSL